MTVNCISLSLWRRESEPTIVYFYVAWYITYLFISFGYDVTSYLCPPPKENNTRPPRQTAHCSSNILTMAASPPTRNEKWNIITATE